MTFTLEIAVSKHSGITIYQVRYGNTRSTWHLSVEDACKGPLTNSQDLEGHHIKFTVPFESIEQLHADYPELFI